MNAAKPLSEPRSQKFGAGCLLIFGLVFLLAGCLFLWIFFLLPLVQTMQAKSWVATEAVVTSNKLEEVDGDDGSTWKPVIHFSYLVDGHERTSTTWSFMGFSSSRKWASRICAKYPIGSKQTCYYDPAKPAEAVLDRTFDEVGWFSLFTLIFVIAGASMMFVAFRMWRYKSHGDLPSPRPLTGANTLASTEHEADVPWAGKSGPQRLVPVTSRMVQVIVIAIFVLIWNGISLPMFVISIVSNGLFGFATLFILIFVLVGVLVIGLLVYMFLGLFNPVISIALSEGAVALGDSVDIAWETEGNVNRISELKIDLIGVEKATYTRGTDTITDTNEFVRIFVAKTSDRETIRFGSASIQIPDNTMHTFAATNNKIEWSIVVKGDIPRWPDIKDTFVFFVKTPDLRGAQ